MYCVCGENHTHADVQSHLQLKLSQGKEFTHTLADSGDYGDVCILYLQRTCAVINLTPCKNTYVNKLNFPQCSET